MRRLLKYLCLVVIAVLITVLIMNNNSRADNEFSATWSGNQSVASGNASQYTLQFNKTIIAFNKYTVRQSGSGKVSFQPYTDQESMEIIGGPDQTLNAITFTCWGRQNGDVRLSVEFEGEISFEDGSTPLDNYSSPDFEITIGETETPATIKTQDGNTSAQLNVGDSIQLVSDKDVSGWTSDAPEVVSVSDGGLITAVNAGNAKIYAYSGNVKSQDFNVTVTETPTPEPPVDSKTPALSTTSIELTVGETASVQVTNSDEVAVDWSNNASLIANFTTYDESSCEIIAVSAGTATITI